MSTSAAAAASSDAPRRVLRADFALACGLFFCSGALGLGYQLIWIRQSELIVGTSQLAVSTVLTSFFLGLALGSLVVGRHLRSRRWSPLFVYGVFEAAIGVLALCLPGAIGAVELGYAALYPLASGSALGLFAIRFALLFLLFLIPTFFMGGTLPLLLDGLVARDSSIGATTSFLYGLNILGAVVGVLVTAYLAIPLLGMAGTSFAAGCGNFAIAAVALAFFGRTPPTHPPAREAVDHRPSVAFDVLAFVSGFAAIGYQVAWIRYFGLFTIATVHLTAIILAVYLLALAVGSMVVAPLFARRAAPLRLLSVVQPLVPLLVVVCLEGWRSISVGFAPDGPRGSWELASSWSFASETLDAIFFAPLVQVGLTLFLPVVLIGTGLPSLIAAATRRSDELRAASGQLVFWNTLGSSAGGFAAGYLLIPWLGMAGAFCLIASLSIALGLGATWLESSEQQERQPESARALWVRPGYVLAVAGALAAAWFVQSDLTRSTLNQYGVGTQVSEGDLLVDLMEGPLTTAFVYRGPAEVTIGSGFIRHGRAPFRSTSSAAIQGHLPHLLHPSAAGPARVLGIALGSGQTFGASLAYPIESLDVVDISSEMTSLALEHFEPFIHGLGEDPRVEFHLDDGRHFVERAPDAWYDIVSMEPPPPTAAAAHGLRSLEFYEQVHRVLRQDGILVQSLPLYLLTPLDTLGNIRTQAAVFPYTFVVRVGAGDFVTLSVKSDGPPRFDPELIAERVPTFGRERMIAKSRPSASAQYGYATLESVLSWILMGPEDVARLGEAPIYRDDTLQLAYTSGDRRLYRRYGANVNVLSFAVIPRTPYDQLARYFARPVPTATLEEERARVLEAYNVLSPRTVSRLTDRYERARTDDARRAAAVELAYRYNQSFDAENAFRWAALAIEADRGDAPAAEREKLAMLIRLHSVWQAERIAAFLEQLPEASRASSLGGTLARELAAYREREAARRGRYLFE